MGCGGSKEGTVTPMGSGKIDYAALKPDEYTAKVHSAIRWGKPIADIEPFFAAKAEGINCEDSKNGNRPIHIAAQNGHLDLVKYLCGKGCDCNAQNGSGNTALHMAMAYDYFWCARILRANGALEDKLNNDNFTELTTSGLTCQHSTDWAICWGSPYFVNIFVRGCQSEGIQPLTTV